MSAEELTPAVTPVPSPEAVGQTAPAYLVQHGGALLLLNLIAQNARLEAEKNAALEARDTALAERDAAVEAKGFDPKTGLLAAEIFQDRVIEDASNTKRYDDPLRTNALMVLDIDKFHDINEHFGHLGADKEVLLPVAEKIKAVTREDTLACRWGGEEFLIYLPNIDPDDAVKVAQRFLDDVNGIKLPVEINGRDHVGISIGIASYDQGANFDNVFDIADKRMLRAKQLGRNQIISNDMQEVTTVATDPGLFA